MRMLNQGVSSMPSRSKKICQTCKQAYATVRCEACYVPWKKYTIHPFSTHKGRKLRDRYKKMHPICESCETRLMNQVDHIVPVSIDPSLSFVSSNFQSLCTQCHEEKSRIDKRRYA